MTRVARKSRATDNRSRICNELFAINLFVNVDSNHEANKRTTKTNERGIGVREKSSRDFIKIRAASPPRSHNRISGDDNSAVATIAWNVQPTVSRVDNYRKRDFTVKRISTNIEVNFYLSRIESVAKKLSINRVSVKK